LGLQIKGFDGPRKSYQHFWGLGFRFLFSLKWSYSRYTCQLSVVPQASSV
jgi:hypothetical protein